jgi:PhnB protein
VISFEGEGAVQMSLQFKPDFYNTVSPFLIVNRARATMNFLIEAFGGKELILLDNEEGKILYGEVLVDDTVIMLADAISLGGPSTNSHIHIYVPDVDAVYKKALELGAKSVLPPMLRADSNKRGAVKDQCGTIWWISTNVKVVEEEVDRCFGCGRFVK